MNSTVSPSCHIDMHHKGLTAARLTYVDGRKRENILSEIFFIIVASTCRCYVQFGLLCNLSLDCKLCLRDDRNAAFL